MAGFFMKFHLILLFAILVLPMIAAGQKRAYVGYKYTGVAYDQKLPNGVRDLGGSLLENENYGVSRMKRGKTEMLWLSMISGRNWSGVPNWKVKDVIFLPTLKKGQEILHGISYPCTVNELEDLNLFVLAQLAPKKNSYIVKKAWRANTRTKKFEALSTKGIACAAADQ